MTNFKNILSKMATTIVDLKQYLHKMDGEQERNRKETATLA